MLLDVPPTPKKSITKKYMMARNYLRSKLLSKWACPVEVEETQEVKAMGNETGTVLASRGHARRLGDRVGGSGQDSTVGLGGGGGAED